MKETEELTLKDMDYYKAKSILKNLLKTGWRMEKHRESKNIKHNLHFISPEGEKFSINAALYYVVTGKRSEGESLFELMVNEEGFMKRTFDRLQEVSHKEEYAGTPIFIKDMED